MRAIDAATTTRLGAVAVGGRSAARLELTRLIRKRLLHCGFAGALAFCLLPVSVNKVWAQLCTCAEPGMMNCSLAGFHSHEPATAAFPQCQIHARGGGGGRSGGGGGGGRHEQFRKSPAAKTSHPHVEYGAGRLIRPPATGSGTNNGGGGGDGAAGGAGGGGGGGGESAANPPSPPAFDPQTSFQIKPLNCPSGLGLVTRPPTFYGGTRCGLPSPAAGAPQPPAQVAQPDETDQTPKDDSNNERSAEIQRIAAGLRVKYGLGGNPPPVGAIKWSPPE
jgi:hypothetical protein